MRAGQQVTHEPAPGEITVQCLQGRIAFTAQGQTEELGSGQFLYFAQCAPYTIRGIEDSTLLMTVLLAGKAGSAPVGSMQGAPTCP